MDREKSYERIIEARRMLDELYDDCEIVEDVSSWRDGWIILLKLRNNGEITSVFPEWTSWYVEVSKDFPKGKITFSPSKIGGIAEVYPHQSPHDGSEIDTPFFSSNLCLEQYYPGLASGNYTTEKLYQYVLQALEWIKRAANGTLLNKGEHFELVAYPHDFQKKVVFSEDEASFLDWQNETENIGFCNIKSGSISNNQNRKIYYITDFYSGRNSYKKEKNRLKSVKWGNYVALERTEEQRGIWLKLNDMPYVEPWEAPRNWGELLEIFKQNRIDFDQIVFPMLNEIRDGLEHFMILGFPIPKIVGNTPVEYFWQAIKLPVLSNVKTSIKRFDGFRKNELGYKMVDKKHIFSGDKKINWMKSENWSSNSLVSRGSFTKKISQLKFLVIGVGSLGSAITELMVRAGIIHMDVIDSDILTMGNLVRHKLVASDIGSLKAVKMEERLTSSNIHYDGKAFSKTFEEFIQKEQDRLPNYDIVIETTGEDVVLKKLLSLKLSAKIFSVSIGIDAKHLYVCSGYHHNISLESFNKKTKSFIEADSISYPADSLPRDGIGCWHPLFPARIDHIEILAGIGVNVIEKDISVNKNFVTVVERERLGTTKIVVRDEIV